MPSDRPCGRVRIFLPCGTNFYRLAVGGRKGSALRYSAAYLFPQVSSSDILFN